MTKQEVFDEIIQKWKEEKGRGICILPTRFGKSILTIQLLKRFLSKNPSKKVIIVVPRRPIKYQWEYMLLDNNLSYNCTVLMFTEALNNVKECDFLVIDEIHTSYSDKYINLYKIKFKLFLGLTATFERLDGKENKINGIPIIKRISKEEAIKNGWINNYKEYKVIIKPKDIDIYKKYDNDFHRYLKIFDNSFEIFQKCLKNGNLRQKLAELKNVPIKMVNACTFGGKKALQERINYIQKHESKLTIVDKIINNKNNLKGIIFVPTIELCNKLASKYNGITYHSELTEKQRNKNFAYFASLDKGILFTVNSLSMGVELNKCDYIIFISNNSSNIEKNQKLGRVLSSREDGMIPEVFTLVLTQTVEEEWFRLSTGEDDYITITEKMLDYLLAGEEIFEERIEGPEMLNRF